MERESFVIVYDTYCGWCYGAAPVFEALVETGADVELLHRQLFEGVHAPRMAHGKGAHVMKADARIAALTGQPFGRRYVDAVVNSATEVLDSTLTAQAAALVHGRGARAELALAARLQQARYVDGVSAADRGAVVAALRAEGVAPDDAERLGSPALVAQAARTAERAQRLLHATGSGGVPTLLRRRGERLERIDHTGLYGQPQRVAELVAARDPATHA